MVDRELRRIKDRLLAPAAAMIGTRVHPTAVSLIGFAVGLGAAAAVISGRPAWALGLWLANRILDGLDGAVARHSGRASDLGGYVDIVLDFILYAALPLAAAKASGNALSAWIAASALLAAFYLNAAVWMSASALLEKRRAAGIDDSRGTTSLLMPRGLVEGFETIVFFSLMIAIPRQFTPIALIMAGMTAVGIIIRLISMIRTLSSGKVREGIP
jgi:phosphatidylglycerophosphate synthase